VENFLHFLFRHRDRVASRRSVALLLLVQQSTVKEGVACQFFTQSKCNLRLENDDTDPDVRRENGATGKVEGRGECECGEQIWGVES
jgi:hypothetical protein